MTPNEREPYYRMSEDDHNRYNSQPEEELPLRRDSGIPAIKKTRGRQSTYRLIQISKTISSQH